ncbi:iron hydrogenase [Iocasia frigidifontis]|uniref:Iron hydrogenase n=1 Tax=Iocasia fonsfrigidae TaxID=2682810 RepID=A0A8A7KLR4_9FIRM|nr:[Fe-Fe] hydrogenase large subunit C-terminal domain-containing protein [Iocasia fonsfrigidae]QTL99024.1 iron hydrogenase [Iocasia fonsfrigidae]
MSKKYNNSEDKRKAIFRELVRLAYDKRLKEKINEIPYRFSKNKTDQNEIASLKNNILVGMGLNPTAKYDTEMADSLETAFELESIKEPIVTVNKNICEECHDNSCTDICVNNTEEGLLIDSGRCISCGKCITHCPSRAIADKIEFIPIVKYFEEGIPVYANVAPAIAGQFGDHVTMGMLRTALKNIGFTDMVEVALFADILSLREADEYNKLVNHQDDFLITSCCCPVWINLLTKSYSELNDRLTKTVSPMIASGRFIKTIFPDAVTVFIGPCVAKKAEAKVPELKGAIDYVLTFDELKEIFQALTIDLTTLEEDNKEQSSYGGRVYARTGGVSEAVKITVERINPDRRLKFKARQADGVKDCKKLLDDIINGNIEANFIEGMGCKGGCVGGPKRNINIDKGRIQVNKYGEQAVIKNPIDNMNIVHILKYISGVSKKEEKIIDQLSYDNLLLREYEKD